MRENPRLSVQVTGGRRVRWLHDSGCRVLIVGHSQGSVPAAVALAQHGALRPGRDRPVLVTLSSGPKRGLAVHPMGSAWAFSAPA